MVIWFLCVKERLGEGGYFKTFYLIYSEEIQFLCRSEVRILNCTALQAEILTLIAPLPAASGTLAAFLLKISILYAVITSRLFSRADLKWIKIRDLVLYFLYTGKVLCLRNKLSLINFMLMSTNYLKTGSLEIFLN